MSNTFHELEIPFPLFEAVTDEASEYAGLASCSLCGQSDRHCFNLGIGCAVMVNCPHCGDVNGLDADDKEDVACHSCGEDVAFPDLVDEEIRTCFECLRAGKAAITKDTAFGMISWEQAIEGLTHGAPAVDAAGFEAVSEGPLGFVRVKLPPEVMFELLRTPGYLTWQGERWQFCCQQPMVYQGPWKRDDFVANAPDGDGRAFFARIVQDGTAEFWDQGFTDCTGFYVFKCKKCQGLAAHWDVD